MSDWKNAPAYETPEAELKPAVQEVIPLQGDQANIYLDMVRRLVKGVNLNKLYPDPTSLENLFRLMSPAANFGLDDTIKVNPRNGMPTEPDIGRVLADKDASKRFLSKNDLPEIFTRTDEASLRLQKRIHYYRDVAKSDLPKRVHLEMKLRNVDLARKLADFIILFERYDPGEGVFTRYTVSLFHYHTRWNKPQIELQGDDLQYTEAFGNVISRYHSDEAEFAFVLLSDVPGIKVKMVERGRVGPLWFTGSSMPPEIEEILEPGQFILNVPFERVEVPEKPKEDLNLDPFGRFYRASLAPEAQAIANKRAEELGYRVHKERKFCCTKGVAERLKKLLAARGSKCVIYAV